MGNQNKIDNNFPAQSVKKKKPMSLVNFNSVVVRNNPESINSIFMFDIQFQCLQDLEGTFDWKVIYVGSANDSSYDQVIESFDMSQLKAGVMQFTIEAPPPDFSRIPTEEIVGNTAVVISVQYEKQEFFRVGYYIRNEYADQEMNENPPAKPVLNQLRRFVMAENPRISHFQIEWLKKEGEVKEDTIGLQKNLEIMGGDPFLTSNGAMQQLENVNCGYEMFGQNGQSNTM